MVWPVHAVGWHGLKEACLTPWVAGKYHNSPRTIVQGQIKTVIDICPLDISLFSQLRHVLLPHVLHQLGARSSSYLRKRNCLTRSASIPQNSKIHTRNQPSSSSLASCSRCRTPYKLDSSGCNGCMPEWYLRSVAYMQRCGDPVSLVVLPASM